MVRSGDALFILALILLLAVVQIMAITVFWHRFGERLRAQEPNIARLVIHAYGVDPHGVERALGRYTRLDQDEIEELVDQRQPGPLPLPMSWRRAHLLAAELRRLGGAAEVEPRTVRSASTRGGGPSFDAASH